MREITKEQFSDNSTIDGRRIDKAVEDIVDRANAVEKRDMKRRFFQTQIVGAYVPSTGTVALTVTPSATDDRLPFMSGNNGTAADNLYRVKGERRTSQTKGAPESLISTASFQFRKPVVITGFSAAFITDVTHTNDFEFEPPASDDNLGKSGDSDDVTLSIS
ncbi:MAG TPA: hypothetical protein EYN66_02295, partial [Myxococcales bacterium]|nr:hypothetical protein [Myxococcales bacterium]